MDLRTIRYKLEQRKGKRHQVQKEVDVIALEVKHLARKMRQHEQAIAIIREVGLSTQQQLQYHISSIVTLALDAVLQHDTYEFKVEFLQRRNKMECDLYFERAGNKVDPLTASGGGAVDVAAFALRIASWSMRKPHTRAVIVLDEPFRFLSVDYQPYASMMIKELSERLGIQFIIVTHEKELAAYADNVVNVGIKNTKSYITQNIQYNDRK
jgi:DNA repair exonuclease SbcCD ATPase subunit